jgi:CRP-like cAMP-binding protein
MLRTLASVPLFKNLDENTLQLLEPLFELFSCTAGAVIFEQGQIAHYVYLLLSGTVEILYKPYDGPPLTVTNLEKDAIFGWSAAIGNTVYTSGAVCKDDCQTVRIRGRDLHELCAREPEAGRIILGLLADSVSSRWDDAQSQIQVLLNTTVSGKQKMKTRMRKRERRTNGHS